MAKVRFYHYMHDSDFGSTLDDITEQALDQGVEITEEMRDLIGRPFYEVTFECELDTETGEVEVVSVRL